MQTYQHFWFTWIKTKLKKLNDLTSYLTLHYILKIIFNIIITAPKFYLLIKNINDEHKRKSEQPCI